MTRFLRKSPTRHIKDCVFDNAKIGDGGSGSSLCKLHNDLHHCKHGQGSTQQQQQFQPSADTSLVQKGTETVSGCQQNEKDYTCQSCHNQLPFSQGEKGTGSAFCIDHQAGNSKEEKKMKDRQKLPAKRPASVSWFL